MIGTADGRRAGVEAVLVFLSSLRSHLSHFPGPGGFIFLNPSLAHEDSKWTLTLKTYPSCWRFLAVVVMVSMEDRRC